MAKNIPQEEGPQNTSDKMVTTGKLWGMEKGSVLTRVLCQGGSWTTALTN